MPTDLVDGKARDDPEIAPLSWVPQVRGGAGRRLAQSGRLRMAARKAAPGGYPKAACTFVFIAFIVRTVRALPQEPLVMCVVADLVFPPPFHSCVPIHVHVHDSTFR